MTLTTNSFLRAWDWLFKPLLSTRASLRGMPDQINHGDGNRIFILQWLEHYRLLLYTSIIQSSLCQIFFQRRARGIDFTRISLLYIFFKFEKRLMFSVEVYKQVSSKISIWWFLLKYFTKTRQEKTLLHPEAFSLYLIQIVQLLTVEKWNSFHSYLHVYISLW